MTPTDAGPLVALIDSGAKEAHTRCLQVFSTHRLPLLTTIACFTEAMYLLGRNLGAPGQEKLWQWYAVGTLRLHFSSDAEVARMHDLMMQYRDAPMDFADASLVAMMETLGLRRIFTLDGHFYAYRAVNGDAFEVVP